MSATNSLIQKLIPKDKRFFPLFDEFGNSIMGACTAFSQFLKETDETKRKVYLVKIQECENRGDELAHQIILELTATFLTPFDREDIHLLASELDTVLDNVLGAAGRMLSYRIKDVPAPLADLSRRLEINGKITSDCLHTLRNIRHPKEFASQIRTLQDNKSEGDDVVLQGMVDLYSGKTEVTEVLKMREIYEAVDNALKHFQEVSFALEAILIKTT